MPKSIGSVGKSIFRSCDSLVRIYIPKGERERFIRLGLGEYEYLFIEYENE
jgi:hypothetical protein